MKHKIKLAFWALGVFVLVLSQLLVFAPAPRALAADPLTLDNLKTRTHNYAVYTTWHSCLGTVNSSTQIADDLKFDISGGGEVLRVVGFAGSDGNDNDGKVTCAEAGKLWMSIAGYADVAGMMTALGFQSTSVPSCTTGMGGSCSGTTNRWTIGSTSTATILSNHERIAKEKGIRTSVGNPAWERYIFSVTALQAKCQPSTTVTGSGSVSSTNTTVQIVGDNLGSLVNATFAQRSDNVIPAFPTTDHGADSNCNYLINEIKNSSHGAAALSTAMANERINTVVSTTREAICERLGFSPNETARQWDDCTAFFNRTVKTCIDNYYNATGPIGSSNYISRSQPFDTGVVAICVENAARQSGYDISRDDIISILGDSQNQATPSGAVTPGEGDICDILGDEVPMKWLACAMLTTLNGITEKLYGVIQDMLYTPIDDILGSDSYNETISTFRVLGMAFIFIVGLIMVIAQSTGSEIVDAYTVRKVLPKLAFAIIGIAVAVPLLKVAITFTNDLGIVAGNFITTTSPDSITNNVKSGIDTAVGGGITFGVLGLLTAAIALYVTGPIAITYIATAALALLLAFLTLAIRQLLVVALVLFAPLAIAAAVLPGTDKLWKFWRTSLITALMMFPIIMIFLKSGVFMASIFGNMGDQEKNGIYYFLAAIVFIAPYFMVPLAFKMAGGLVGNIFGIINDRGKGLFDRMSKARDQATQARYQHRKQRLGRWGNQKAVQWQRDLKGFTSTDPGKKNVRKFLARRGANILDGYQGNLEARTSAYQAAESKTMTDQIQTGMDDEPRGLTVNKAAALNGPGSVLGAVDAEGYRTAQNGLYRLDASGKRQFKTLGGKWLDEASVDRAYTRWGHNTYAQQAALTYEMTKIGNTEDVQSITDRYASLSRDAWGMSKTESDGAWIGSSFANQGAFLSHKYTKRDPNGNVSYDYAGLAQELYEKRGSWQLGQLHASDYDTLIAGYNEAKSVVEADNPDMTSPAYIKAQQTKQQIEAITESYVHSGYGGQAVVNPAEDGKPPQEVPLGGGLGRTASLQGAAHTNERALKLAALTGVLAQAPNGVYTVQNIRPTASVVPGATADQRQKN